MPLYNTAPPSAGNNNSINSITPSYGIRDFLLTKNLVFPAPYNLISMSLNGSPKPGQPVVDTIVGNGSVIVPIGLPLETFGITYKDSNVSVNDFQNNESTANDLTQIEYIIPIDNPDYQTSIWPSGSEYPSSANPDVNENYGILPKTNEAQYRKDNTIKNLYLDASKQIDVSDFISLSPLDISQQVKGYLDTYGGLNLGGSAGIQALDKAGSILNGQGLGFAKAGVVTNFDIRSSLAGRVLGATGLINDTKLGLIGGQQLALALANNAAFNVQEDILGSLNLQNNILSLVKGDGLAGLRPNYKVTVPSGTLAKAADYTARVLGFTLPRSYMTDGGSIFQAENNNSTNIDRVNELLKTTGKGQIQALASNFKASLNGIANNGVDSPDNTKFRSGYAPGFDYKGNYLIDGHNIYAFNHEPVKSGTLSFFPLNSQDKIIPDLNYLREQKVKESGFYAPEDFLNIGKLETKNVYSERKVSDITFSWGSNIPDDLYGKPVNADGDYTPIGFVIPNDKKSLLFKTQQLFDSVGMKSIVSVKGDMNKESTQLQTANGHGFSKGNAVMTAKMFNLDTGTYKDEKNKTAEETYCRSWTTYSRYDTVSRLVRHRGLYASDKLPFRTNYAGGSVLDDNGFAKIAPYTDDNWTADDPKRYMFSIENLAWCDDLETLPECEKGPGDLVTGKRGRIMWFPPYDINFTENSSVNWESTNFIGRGEPVYTYNNTERSGTLSFKVIIDHPTNINAMREGNASKVEVDDSFVNSFWAGCLDDVPFAKNLSTIEKSQSTTNQIIYKKETKEVPTNEKIEPLRVYFANDNYDIVEKYENGLSGASKTQWINYSVNPNGFGYGSGQNPAQVTGAKKESLTKYWDDRYNYGLNYSDKDSNNTNTKVINVNGKSFRGIFDSNAINIWGEYLTETCPYCYLDVTGYASVQGNPKDNQTLANNRADSIIKYLEPQLLPIFKSKGLTKTDLDKRLRKTTKSQEIPSVGTVPVTDTVTNLSFNLEKSAAGCVKCPPVDEISKKYKAKFGKTLTYQTRLEIGNRICPNDSLGCKLDRYSTVEVKFDENLWNEKTTTNVPIATETTTTTVTTIKNVYTECDFFDKLIQSNKFVFDTFRERIKYFHPAFHSTTPEGFNSRLTFLLQCTRQGKTFEQQGATNLAFGRPPVCILRIGDFYNTKIVIDNVGFDYEPLVWDLNPEGIGVQPMIANVNISFKFIGGSTLRGPLNRLQNALSFNYFANTHVYDTRADYLKRSENKWGVVFGELNVNKSTTTTDPVTTTIPYPPTSLPINQEASNENVLTNEQTPMQQASTASTSTMTGETCDVLSLLKLASVAPFDEGDDSIILSLVWQPSDKIKNLSIQSSRGIEVSLLIGQNNEKVVLNYIYAKPNSSKSISIESDEGSSVIALSENQTINFPFEVIVVDSAALEKLKQVSKNSDNKISIKVCGNESICNLPAGK